MNPPSTNPTASASGAGTPILGRLTRLLCRRLWLPRGVYEALPYFYVVSGLAALFSALYLPGWTWILPYVVLLGAVCLHAGIAVLTLRWRARRARAGKARRA